MMLASVMRGGVYTSNYPKNYRAIVAFVIRGCWTPVRIDCCPGNKRSDCDGHVYEADEDECRKQCFAYI